MSGKPWTDADVQAGARAVTAALGDRPWRTMTPRKAAIAVLDALTAAGRLHDDLALRRAATNGAVWALLHAAGTGDHFVDPAELRELANQLLFGERLVPPEVAVADAGSAPDAVDEAPRQAVPDTGSGGGSGG